MFKTIAFYFFILSIFFLYAKEEHPSNDGIITIPSEKKAQNSNLEDSLFLILDRLTDLDLFRKIDAPFPEKENTSPPSREGLEGLNYSGSAQFSEKGLEELQKKLNQKDLIIVDLRRESHGFINGLPVSWMNVETGLSNQGLDEVEILEVEKKLLRSEKKDEHIIIYKVAKEDLKRELIPMPTTVNRTSTESNLAAKMGIGYVRIPVSDHRRPLDPDVDNFIQFYRTKPNYAWVHFHCKGGSGRTSTFLTMVDMLHNAKNVSFDTIMKRQFLINGTNLLEPSTPLALKFIDEFNERLSFLKEFYQYCKDNNDDYQTSWTQFISKQPSQTKA